MLCPFLLSNKKITLLQYTLNISQKAASIRNSVNVRRTTQTGSYVVNTSFLRKVKARCYVVALLIMLAYVIVTIP